MKKFLLILFCAIFIAGIAQDTVKCTIETSKGNILIELYPDAAPVTVANFLTYVDAEAYNGSSFFRVCTPENEAERNIKIQVIQGGNIAEESMKAPIKIETTEETGILHKNGTLSMARGAPNSATSSFFICIEDQPELDFNGKRNPDGYGFAAFGSVLEGMDVVLEIQKGSNTNQILDEPVEIIAIKKS